jgi:hypothetical protein
MGRDDQARQLRLAVFRRQQHGAQVGQDSGRAGQQLHAQYRSRLEVRDMAGRTVFAESVFGEKDFDPAPMARGRAGLYAVSHATEGARLTRKVFLDGR